MHRRLRQLIIAAGILLVGTGVFAGDVRMTIEPDLISLLDRAVLKIEFIDTKGDTADLPDIDGLEIRYQGKQTQYNLINGHASAHVVHTYVVTPTKVGDYTVGPVKIKYKGGEKTLSSRLRVIKPEDDAEAQQLSQLLFSEISTLRDAPYVHEPFDLELKVYVRDGRQIVEQFGVQGGLPESGLDGELNWQAEGRSREQRNGAIYNVYRFHATAKALTPGTLSFNPQVQVPLVIPRQQRRPFGMDDPFFGDFFGRQESRLITLDCNTLNVHVKPIPTEGRPASFGGSVGVMDFGVTASPTTIKAGDPVTLKMRITGAGNLKKTTPPSMAETPGFKRYDTRVVPTENPNEMLFEQVVIPTSDSIKEIPPVSFSYFNTQTADFRTITKGPFPITVEPAPRQAAQVIMSVPTTAQQETKVLGHDIAYLKPKPSRWTTDADIAFHRTPAFRIAVVVPALLLAMTALVTTKRNRLANDVALARRQEAPKAARRNVHRAEQAIKKKDTAAFNEAMWTALTEYFGHKLNLAPGQVTLQSVQSRIPTEAETLQGLFGTMEQRRYAVQGAADSPEEMQQLLRTMVETFRKCERMKL